jgi:hypothetical protein
MPSLTRHSGGDQLPRRLAPRERRRHELEGGSVHIHADIHHAELEHDPAHAGAHDGHCFRDGHNVGRSRHDNRERKAPSCAGRRY